MVRKDYAWADGAVLEEHSKRKHKILQEYLREYLRIRCQQPNQGLFRLAIVDGFAGAGIYQCGSLGSPLLFLEEVKLASQRFNVERASQGLKPLKIECLLIFNDASSKVIEALKANIAPRLLNVGDEAPQLSVSVQTYSEKFEAAYAQIAALISASRINNVIFNLDQYGHSHVEPATVSKIMRSFPSAEVFLTFAISALVAFLKQADPLAMAKQLEPYGELPKVADSFQEPITKRELLGGAERMVFEALRGLAPYVSPFAINNPEGWRYWLVHFASFYRARQAYNNVLHDNSSSQAHFGRSGLDMLSFDPREEGALYLFDLSGRERAREQLSDDVPRVVDGAGDAMSVDQFYGSFYNFTPAHADDIHQAIIESPDLEVLTPKGGVRRVANQIAVGDVLRLRRQRTFFPLMPRAPK